jgi:hypothetical protein
MLTLHLNRGSVDGAQGESGMMVGGGEQTPLVEAPALAEIARWLVARPFYLADQPIAVEPQLWHQAQGELRDVLEQRGWPLLGTDKAKQPNFLFRGVAVVMNDG